MLKVSESYIIGIDIGISDDEAAITVIKHEGSKLVYTNLITGKDAIKMYEKITGKSFERGINKNG